MSEIRFSMIVPMRNLQWRLPKVLPALLAVLRQNPDWELCIGDDLSDDGTARKIQELENEPRVKVYLSDVHLGRGALRNRLCWMAEGELLVFLDGDCIPLEGWAQAWRRAAGVFPASSLVGRVRYEDEDQVGLSRYMGKALSSKRIQKAEEMSCAFFHTGNSAVTASAFRKINGFREDFRGWGGEDFDLGLRLEKAEVPLHLCPKAEVLHPPLGSLKSFFDRQFHFGEENLRRLMAEHPEHATIYHLEALRHWWAAILVRTPLAGALRSLVCAYPKAHWPDWVYRWSLLLSWSAGYVRSRS